MTLCMHGARKGAQAWRQNSGSEIPCQSLHYDFAALSLACTSPVCEALRVLSNDVAGCRCWTEPDSVLTLYEERRYAAVVRNYPPDMWCWLWFGWLKVLQLQACSVCPHRPAVGLANRVPRQTQQ